MNVMMDFIEHFLFSLLFNTHLTYSSSYPTYISNKKRVLMYGDTDTNDLTSDL